jgi:hypothetical protein
MNCDWKRDTAFALTLALIGLAAYLLQRAYIAPQLP